MSGRSAINHPAVVFAAGVIYALAAQHAGVSPVWSVLLALPIGYALGALNRRAARYRIRHLGVKPH